MNRINMKQFFITIATLFALVGCVKELNPQNTKQQDKDPKDTEAKQVEELVKLNLKISSAGEDKSSVNKTSANNNSTSKTKAVKSAWEEGDNIYLYFLEESDTAFEKKPSAVITYNGSEWTVSTPADQEQINSITESGYILAQYIAGPKRTLGEVDTIAKAYGEIQQAFSNYTLENNLISATLNLSQVCSQIVITNLNAEDGWIIESPNAESYTSFNGIYNAEINYSNETPQIKAVYTGFDSPKIYGVANADGVAFYANTITNNSQPVKIILRKVGSPISYSKTFGAKQQFQLGKAYKLGGPEIDESGGLIRANGWETVTPSNKIIFTRTSPEIPFPIAGSSEEYFGANLIKTEYYEAEGFGELVFDGPVTKIGVDAFKNNAALTSITLPNGITEINDYAFYRCTDLSSVNLPNGLTTIGKEAFCECTSLESIAIPRSVTTIGVFAFYNSIEKNTIRYIMAESAEDEIVAHHSSIEYWGANYVDAQYQNTGYGYIIFDGPVTKIGDGVFAGLNYFESISIPSSVTTIGESAFYNCDNLTSISIPESVTSICNNAFFSCSSLTNVTIPNINNISIGDYAFSATPWWENKPESGLWCDRGNIVCGYIGEMPENTSITIPDGMTSIIADAFRDQTNLKSITIPESVTSIGDRAFQACDKLSTIYSKASTPPNIGNFVVV